MEVVERFHRPARVSDRLHLMAGLFEHRANETSDIPIVVDDEDPTAEDLAPLGRGDLLVEHL